MRTVICHFFDEEYLLPWWLTHHLRHFDHGILIDHGSTDNSADICRTLAPHWRLVRSRLMKFDAFLTDFEVMQYEQEMPGWKIALNVTEFLAPTSPLAEIERHLVEQGRAGCAGSGYYVVDEAPDSLPVHEQPLLTQKHHGFDDNAITDAEQRQALGLDPMPMRNRFYHRDPVGMYIPGRHRSYHPDSTLRLVDLPIFYYGFAPWNERVLRRKLQIRGKLRPEDVKRGWGAQHVRDEAAWNAAYDKLKPASGDLMAHPRARMAIERYAG